MDTMTGWVIIVALCVFGCLADEYIKRRWPKDGE